MIGLLVAALCMLAGDPPAPGPIQGSPAPAVAKVDPPSWWPGHTLNPIRLLVRGRGLKGASVSSSREDVRPSDVRVSDSGTWLFVSLDIAPHARPGDASLRIETAAGPAVAPFRLDPPIVTTTFPGGRGISKDDVIYLVMTDRFCNGDTSNDAPAGADPRANGRDKPRGYHGGDLRGVIDRLPYLESLGITALWLTPWYENFDGLYCCDKPWCPYSYYHGYHPIDHYAVEQHFGTMDTLRELVIKAHARGIKIVQDQICNQVGLHHAWVEDPPLPGWIHGTPKHHVLNTFQLDLISSPHVPQDVRAKVLDGWFSDDSPDLDQDEPELARYLIQNALWWVGMTGVDAIREDTAQYLPRPFLRSLCDALHRQHPDLTLVAEVLDLDPLRPSFFLGGKTGWDGIDTRIDSVFDFPTWGVAVNVFSGKLPMTELRRILGADLIYSDPSRLTTLTGNHDVKRFLAWPGATLDGAKLHMAFTLTIRGTPQLYYGDEIAMPGGDDPDNRRDFPGGFVGDKRSAFLESGRTADEQAMFVSTRAWIALRKAHPAIRRGTLLDLFADKDIYLYARQANDETVVIALNRASEPKTASFPAASVQATSGASLQPLLNAAEIPSREGTRFSVRLSPRSASAYVIK